MDFRSMAEELLSIQVRISRQQLNQRMDNFSKGELRALSFIYDHGKQAYPVDLSREMNVSSARVAVLLNHMEEKGWVRRSSDVHDQRHTLVTLQPAGLRILLDEREDTLSSIVQLLEMLGPEDAEEYLRIRRRILRGQ